MDNKKVLVGSLAFLLILGVIMGTYYNLPKEKIGVIGKDIPILTLDCGYDEGESCSTWEGTFNYIQNTLALSKSFIQEGSAVMLVEELNK